MPVEPVPAMVVTEYGGGGADGGGNKGGGEGGGEGGQLIESSRTRHRPAELEDEGDL